MDPHELEEFAQFLRMAEMAGGGGGGGVGALRKSPTSVPAWWQGFPAKVGLSVGTFGAAILFFRTYGASLV